MEQVFQNNKEKCDPRGTVFRQSLWSLLSLKDKLNSYSWILAIPVAAFSAILNLSQEVINSEHQFPKKVRINTEGNAI